MAASTISRTGVTLTNDTGSAATPVGDGTLLNAAWCSTFLDRIDALFSGALTIGGVFTAEGFGTHALSASGTGAQTLSVRNTSAGTSNESRVLIGNDSDVALGGVFSYSSTYTSTGPYVANGTAIQGSGAGGLGVVASHASGAVKFYAGNNTTERARFTSSGHLVLAELTTNPTTDDCAADAALAIYTKADKLVFAYNNGGTLTFITLDLDGSDTTWTHGTSAP